MPIPLIINTPAYRCQYTFADNIVLAIAIRCHTEQPVVKITEPPARDPGTVVSRTNDRTIGLTYNGSTVRFQLLRGIMPISFGKNKIAKSCRSL